MAIYIDSGNIDEIKEALERYPYINGITTNPILVSQAGTIIQELVPAIRKLTFKTVFAQVEYDNYEEMVKNAMGLSNLLHPNAVVKIPFCPQGIEALQRVGGKTKTCITAVSTITQALIAAYNGADYVAVYVGRIANYGPAKSGKNKGLETVEQISAMFENRGLKTRILAASIKVPSWIEQLLILPNVDVTAPLEILIPCFDSPVTTEAIKQFETLSKKKTNKNRNN